MEHKHLLVVIDARTNRIVWSINYTDWPRMVPLDPQLNIISFNGKTICTDKDINNFRTSLSNGEMINIGSPLPYEKDNLKLLKMKCRVCWRWLKGLYDWQRSVTSYLPDVPVGKKGSTERQLYNDQKEAIAEIIAEEIADFHHIIWQAKTIEELEVIADNLHDKRDFVVKQ